MSTGEVQLPKAIESELELLGSLLLEPAFINPTLRILQPADFFDERHRFAFGVLRKMHRNGTPITTTTFEQALEDRGSFKELLPDDDTAASYAFIVKKSVVTSAHWEYHAGRILEASRKRRLHFLAVTAATHALNGSSSKEVLADVLSDLDDMRREFVNGQRFRSLSSAELDSGDFAVRFLVSWLLVELQPCILAGGKKSLKTTLLIALGLAIATGADFLGTFKTTGARTFVLCSGESGLGTIQETARRIATAMGWELANVPNFIVTDELPRLDDDSDLSEFAAFLERVGAEVVAIDPAYLCMGGDDHGNLFKQGPLLLRLARLCQERGITLILCHHTRKHRTADLATFDPPELEDIAWAGFQEFARQWLLVGRRERYEPGTGLHRLWLNVGGSVGHGGLWALDVDEGRLDDPGGRIWSVAIAKAAEARNAAEQRKANAKAKRSEEVLEADRNAIVEAVCGLPDREGTKSGIKTAVGFNTRRFDPAFAAAIQAGDLIETTITKANGQTYEGYKLALENDQQSQSDSLGFHSDSAPNPSADSLSRTPPLKGESESECVGMAESGSVGLFQGESE